MSAQFARVPLSVLSVGTVLTTPIFDPNRAGSKLLGENIEINAQFLRQLEERGIDSVVVSQKDLAAIHSGTPQGNRIKVDDHEYQRSALVLEQSAELDESIGSGGLDESSVSFDQERPIETREDAYDTEAMSGMVQEREQQIGYVDQLFVNLLQGDGHDSEGLSHVCRDSIRSVVSDKDMFLCLGLNPYHSDYPARHSLHVCSVATSIGVMLGLDDASLIDLGTGCLIHDVGMMKLDEKLYKSKRRLTKTELTTLSDHPILTLGALACPGVHITRVARVVAYQIHERCNGTGYPQGRTGDQIHILAKIAAVADAYVALVSNRSHRRGMLPYYAMEKILKGVSEGLFDPKPVRGLLEAISLFPIGSFVETTDGKLGRVVRATGVSYTKPIIELWNEKHRQFEPELVNLSEANSIEIARAATAPKMS